MLTTFMIFICLSLGAFIATGSPKSRGGKMVQFIITETVCVIISIVVGNLLEPHFPPNDNGPEAAPNTTSQSSSTETRSSEKPYITQNVPADIDSLGIARIDYAYASSELPKADYSYEAERAVDGNPETSWQEGVAGSGKNEWIEFAFHKNYPVSCIAFRLGNWRDKTKYKQNDRPHELWMELGNEEYLLEFPDGKKVYYVVFPEPQMADSLCLTIDSVYSGSENWQDCCISEVTVYIE